MVRCLLYLAQTYQEYFESTKQNVYGSKKLELPKPEMYVIFTGNIKTYVESREKEASEKTKIETAQKLYKKDFP